MKGGQTMRTPQNIVNQRVKEIVEKLLEGESRSNLIRFISDNYEVGERQAENYLKKANEELKTLVEKDLTRDYNKAVLRYEKLYNLHFTKKDFKTCIGIN
jgi:hypothetical protein